MTVTDRLADVEAIHQLKARYCRFVDTKRWHEWRDLFVDELQAVLSGVDLGGYSDADLFVQHAKAKLEALQTIHHGHLPEVTITGPTTACGIWAVSDYLYARAGEPIAWGFGYYKEDYRKVDGEWKIASWRLERLQWHDSRTTAAD